MKQRNNQHLIFWAYVAVMVWLLFFKDRGNFQAGIPYFCQLKYNLIPFETVRLFVRLLDSSDPDLRRLAVVNLGGNIIMFIPLGWLLPARFPKLRSLVRTLAAVAVMIICVELIQLFALVGSCDTDDLILNVSGATIGFWMYRIWNKGAA